MPPTTTEPIVTLIGWTRFQAPPDVPWEPEPGAPDGQSLVELAGRACYGSWSRPNPATAANGDYIRHILQVGHLSVLEHGVASFYLRGVSRTFTHELVRHRHLSYSQLSQRYVDESGSAVVEPDVIAGDPESHKEFNRAVSAAQRAYDRLVERQLALIGQANPTWTKTQVRKAARQAARSVLPNATETSIVVTGNYRAWRHFVDMRATEHADVEIREVAIAILRKMQQLAPDVFDDYTIKQLDDGTEVASSPYAGVDG